AGHVEAHAAGARRDVEPLEVVVAIGLRERLTEDVGLGKLRAPVDGEATALAHVLLAAQEVAHPGQRPAGAGDVVEARVDVEMEDLEEALDHELLAVDEGRELDGCGAIEIQLRAGQRVGHVTLASFGLGEVHPERLEVYAALREVTGLEPTD